MRNEARGDVWKVWYYATVSVLLGAWMAPLVYNAGKALAEVSDAKSTNGFIEWLAGICRTAEFPAFYESSLLIAALILFIPWMEWIHAKRGRLPGADVGPWRVRLPDGARSGNRGQRLVKNAGGVWQGCAGFLVVSGLLLSLGVALVPAGFFTMNVPPDGLAALAIRVGWLALALAVVMEVFFRGIVMGIFLRAMRPAAALGMSAAFFALVLSMIPHSGYTVADPDASRVGFELLGLVLASFADWRIIVGGFIPLMALGAVLAYARWRTGSLWMPVGLHTGWLFAKGLLEHLTKPEGGATMPMPAGEMIQQGLVPLIAILLAGLLAHFLTSKPEHENAIEY